MQVKTAKELLSMEISELPMLVEGFIPKCGLSAIVGGSDTGKSTLLRQLAICVATGTDWLDKKVNCIHQNAIYVSSEDDDIATAYLLNKQNKGLLFEVDELEGLRYIFDTNDLLAQLDKEIERHHVDLVAIDTFGDIIGGVDMNNMSAIRKVLNDYSQLALRHHCAIIFLHHTRKGSEEQVFTKDSINGSQGFEAKMRVVLGLTKYKGNDGLRNLSILKGNYIPASEKNKVHVLEFDDNMVFHDTGERADVDQIKGNIKKKVFDDALHKSTIQHIFSSGSTTYSSKELRTFLSSALGIGESKARDCIYYYQKNDWIVNKSNNPQKSEYQLSSNCS